MDGAAAERSAGGAGRGAELGAEPEGCLGLIVGDWMLAGLDWLDLELSGCCPGCCGGSRGVAQAAWSWAWSLCMA